MTCMETLKRFLFAHVRTAGGGGSLQPIGVPLYAYRCSERSYQSFQSQVRKSIPQALAGNPPAGFEACFCLYASETFRREHAGGPWAWRTVFEPLGVDVPANPVIADWVGKGLRYWGREIIIGAAGRRLALATIACEGGLPLRLLQKEGANLRTFFRRMLHTYHDRSGSTHSLEALARNHLPSLPQTLRNEEVVRLAAELVGRTVELQEQIGDALDPIAALDEVVPGWRTSLPLRLEDDVAASLFGNLVEDARSIAMAMAARPAWKGSLRLLAGGRLIVEKALRFPSQLERDYVARIVGAACSMRTRLRLVLQTRNRQEPVAVLTEVQSGLGKEPVFRREWVRHEGAFIYGSAVLEPHQLLLHDGLKQCVIDLGESEPWGDSPWIFLPTKDSGRWRWLAEGSVYTRERQAVVVVPEDYTAQPGVDARCDFHGELPELQRRAFLIEGEVEFLTPDGDRYRVACNASAETEETPRLSGRQLDGVLNETAVFRGCPAFNARSEGHTRIGESELQWRPVGGSHSWSGNLTNCAGRVWLRLVEPRTGIERLRRMADVVPADFEIQRDLGSQHKPGRYELSASSLSDVAVLSAGSQVEVAPGEGRGAFSVTCQPIPKTSFEPLRLELSCNSNGSVLLELPHPQKGATFFLDGRSCAADELVAIDRLHGLWLVIQNPSGGDRFTLHTELLDVRSSLGRLGSLQQLPPLQKGELRLNLGLSGDSIKYLLATSDDPDASVRLTVCSTGGEEVARLRVARYDMTLVPDRGTQSVQLPPRELEKLGDGWSDRLVMQMLPLWSPREAPVTLPLSDGVRGQWMIPSSLRSGPWWIVGSDGEWKRFRPLLWTIADDGADVATATALEPELHGLAGAVREPNAEIRIERIKAVLEDLGGAPDHPDWELLQGYLDLGIEYPPNTVDTLRHLIRNPRTLAMALFRADAESFERLMAFADQMPFAWGLLPVTAWKEAAVNYYRYLEHSLSAIDGGAEICWSMFEAFRQRAAAARPFFHSLCDWLQESVFPDRSFVNNNLKVTRALQTEFIVQQVDVEVAELLARHGADEYWPLAQDVIELADGGLLDDEFRFAHLTQFQRPTRCAPFVAAAIALGGHENKLPKPELVYELRVVRGFDTEWFDRAYALGLTLGLARGNWEGSL